MLQNSSRFLEIVFSSSNKSYFKILGKIFSSLWEKIFEDLFS